MKKTIIVLLSCFILLFGFDRARAYENHDLYAYSFDTSSYDSYAENKVWGYLSQFSSNYDIENALLGRGVYVENYGNEVSVIYPVWIDDQIVFTYTVFDDGNVTCGSFSGSLAEELNALARLTSYDKPLRIIYGAAGLSFIIDGIKYNLSTWEEEEVEIDNLDYSVIGNHSNALMDYITASSACTINSPTNYTHLSWTTHAIYPGYVTSCVPMSLYNIFKNKGINTYSSYQAVGNAIVANTSETQYYYLNNYTSVPTFLNAVGISYGTHGSTYLTFSYCDSMVLAGSYGMAFGTLNGSYSNQHAVGIIGCAYINGDYSYILFDPHGSSSSGGKVYLDTYNRTYYYHDGSLFKWQSGYVSYIGG